MSIEKIVKRDGLIVNYDRDRITTAIFKAASEVGGKDRDMAEKIAEEVEKSSSILSPPPLAFRRGNPGQSRGYAHQPRPRQNRARLHRLPRRARQSPPDPRPNRRNIRQYPVQEDLRGSPLEYGPRCETVYGLNRIIAEEHFRT